MELGRILLFCLLILVQLCRPCVCSGLGNGIPGSSGSDQGVRRRKKATQPGNDKPGVAPSLSSSSSSSSLLDNARNLMEIVASGLGEYTFQYDTTDGVPPSGSPGTGTTPGAGGDNTHGHVEMAQGAPLPGPGCSFDNGATTFLEGQSMGTYQMIHDCANNVPEAFPCYCISGAPGQSVCPYCFYRDTFNNNICGRSGEIVGVLHPNRTLINCQCTVTVSPFGNTYDVKISSNCEMVDLTTAAPMTDASESVPAGGGFGIDTQTAPPAPQPSSVFQFPTTPGPTSTFFFPTTPAPADVATGITTITPLAAPVAMPTPLPTLDPTSAGALDHTIHVGVTYQPGNLTVYQEGLWLSQGLSARILAIAGEPVPYEAPGSDSLGGSTIVAASRQPPIMSSEEFHYDPDGADVFLDNRPTNSGGWIYVSNSEKTNGGVGAMTFNAQGQVIDYRRLLQGTLWNCNGGRTPWGTWITAEEDTERFEGRLWQVDPHGVRNPMPLTLGGLGGAWEAFAFDIRDLSRPYYFVTEDDEKGALRRWTPNAVVWGMDPWMMLHGPGQTEFLMLEPDFENGDGNNGTFRWTTDEDAARDNAKDWYPYSEGIDIHGNIMNFVCKGDYVLFRLNLDTFTYERKNTQAGLFDGEPDQVRTILQEDGSTLLYFSEDYGRIAGVHARDEDGNFFTILEGPDYSPETTGISFSPDGKHMYFQFQEDGYMFDITRDDGLSFHATTVNLKPRLTEDPRKYRKKRQ